MIAWQCSELTVVNIVMLHNDCIKMHQNAIIQCTEELLHLSCCLSHQGFRLEHHPDSSRTMIQALSNLGKDLGRGMSRCHGALATWEHVGDLHQGTVWRPTGIYSNLGLTKHKTHATPPPTGLHKSTAWAPPQMRPLPHAKNGLKRCKRMARNCKTCLNARSVTAVLHAAQNKV